jgi:hypothetical protein
VVRKAPKTASYFTQSATTGFIANIFPYRNRVSLKEAFEGPEPDDGKLSRPVLRGPAPSNGGWLLGIASLRHLLGWIVSAFRSREDLVVENLALRRQLLALHAQRPRRRLTALHKLLGCVENVLVRVQAASRLDHS